MNSISKKRFCGISSILTHYFNCKNTWNKIKKSITTIINIKIANKTIKITFEVI
jgi:hypothetical protein